MKSSILIAAIVTWAGTQFSPSLARADDTCRVVHVDMTPSDDLQIVVWIEDMAGNYVDTAFITRKTGSLGIGNRPGIMEFNSAPLWCYGRRESTFPVWAHRHGLSWPKIIFQDGDDRDLSHAIAHSSIEQNFCRPLDPNRDQEMWDAQTCATAAFTDKGKFHPIETSLYPPRNDFTLDVSRDSQDAPSMRLANPFDAVSKPTPAGGLQQEMLWPIPSDLPDGDYVAWVEVSKEFDHNAQYSVANYPSPKVSWSSYGLPYRGQPSVVYKVPFAIGTDAPVATQLEYVGYGDPDGQDGELRPPDETITTGVAGSGAGRLLLSVDEADQMFRVAVQAISSQDDVRPDRVGDIAASGITTESVDLAFTSVGDDGQEGVVAAYEVRYLAGREITDANWNEGIEVSADIVPLEPGKSQSVFVDGLLPNTNYYIGVRGVDECLNAGLVASTMVRTPRPEPGEVDACFVATAAYGSLMANEVSALRGFRDRFLRSHVTGEIAVESYYTFGPALAKLIQPVPLLRRIARAGLRPIVDDVKRLSGSPQKP